MINTNNRRFTIQRKESLEGKKEKTLIIECRSCSEFSNFRNNDNCFYCVFNSVFENRKKKFNKIYIEAIDSSVDQAATRKLLDYFNQLEKIRDIHNRVLNQRGQCVYKDFDCKVFGNYETIFSLTEREFVAPIHLYLKVQEFIREIKGKKTNDSLCVDCVQKNQKILENIVKMLENLEVVRFYNESQRNSSLFDDPFYYYEVLLLQTHIRKKTENEDINFSRLLSLISEKKEKLLQKYIIGKELYRVEIFEVENKIEKKYRYFLNINPESERSYFESLVDAIASKIQTLTFEDVVSLEDLIALYEKEAIRIVEQNYKIEEVKAKKIAFFTAIKYLRLEKLFPLLLDDFIEEIFLDSPDSELYLDHQKFGRCRTDLKLTAQEIERVITFLRLYSSQRLDYSNPTLKFVIKNKYFFCRFAVDVKPVNINDFSLDIRKLNKNILTIQDLVKNHTLNARMAAFLYFCSIKRVNITVTGETDTGKTTLINAFDIISPEYFRKIYVENAVESLEQLTFNKHQLKYQADSLDDTINRYTKSNQIKNLLHRTPDLIYLGEILTQEEAEALFHCLAAGLRGYQTIHSNSVDSLINRFIHTFKINFSQLDDLDLIILMKRDFNARRIASISEIDLTHFQTGEYNEELFLYNPKTKEWDQLKNLFESKTISRLKKFERLDEQTFNEYIEFYEEIFEYLLKSEKINNKALVELFHELFRYSPDISEARRFWNEWKDSKGNKNLDIRN